MKTIFRSYNPLETIAMDRFVFKLWGKEKELILRRSLDSAVTLKHSGQTVAMYPPAPLSWMIPFVQACGQYQRRGDGYQLVWPSPQYSST